jgi:hypothetical protein
MPAQPGDDAGTLGDQVFTMIDQQPQLTLDPIQARDRQIRFTQRGPRHRQRINRIGFAIAARRVTHMSHQLRRDPHHRLTRGDQVTLEPPGQVPAILDRPQPLLSQLGARVRVCPPSLGGCSFSDPVSHRDLLTCDGASCLTRCHRAFVSNSCHFFRTPLSIPWRHIQSLRDADQPVRKVPSRDGAIPAAASSVGGR